jgi:hypothetical protein
MSLKPKKKQNKTKRKISAIKSEMSSRGIRSTFNVKPEVVEFLIKRYGDTKTTAIFKALEKEGVKEVYGADSVSSNYGESRILVDLNISGGEIFYYWDGHAAHKAAVDLIVDREFEAYGQEVNEKDVRKRAESIVIKYGFELVLEGDDKVWSFGYPKSRLIKLGANGYLLMG